MLKLKTILRAFLLLLAMSQACAAAPTPGEWKESEESFGFPKLYLYLPKNPKPALAGKRALMVVLHGCGQSAGGDMIDKRMDLESPAEQYGMVIAAPNVPATSPTATRLVAGCWDWFGTQQQRGARDIGMLAAMIEGLKADAELNIDPNQIYMIGLSSGSAVANIFACLYPEVLAGVGLHSGGALGAPVTDIMRSPSISTEDSAALCKRFAGDNKNALTTQITSVIQGSRDRLVPAAHGRHIRDTMRLVYGATEEAGEIKEANHSDGMLYKDAKGKIRVAYIEVEGLGHAASVGSGGSGGGLHGMAFHDYTHVAYPVWVSKFFFENNLRVKR